MIACEEDRDETFAYQGAGVASNAAQSVAADEVVNDSTDGFVRNETDKAGGSRFSLVHAFGCAGSGVLYALRTQRNMKIHGAVAVIAIVLGIAFAIDAASWLAIIICIALVFAAECLNTALESVVDLVSPGYHELARRAKDCAAGAVFICALAAVLVAAVVFIPPIWALLFP